MTHQASRRGAVNLGTVLMIAAFAVIAGFIYWLSLQAAAERAAVEVAETEETQQEESGSMGSDVMVTLGEALTTPDMEAFVGEEIRGVGYEVASALGKQGFWVNTASGNPFLVSWSESQIAEGATVAAGDTVTVVGEMMRMEPSVLDAWTAAETISETDRIVAEFATHFVAASDVDVTSGGGAE